MAIFPQYTSIGYANPLIKTIRTKTLISNYETDGEEKRRQKWLFHKWDLNLSYNYITKAEARTLWQFFVTHKGQATAFNFFDGHTSTYSKEFVAVGNASSTTFNLPFKSGTSITIYKSSTPVSSASYSIDGSGASGASRIIFSSSAIPSSGAYIKATFTGKLKVRARFADETMSFETFYNRLVTTGLDLRGLANA